MTEWESHEPGYFSVALFDHRKCYRCGRNSLYSLYCPDMPICDGVEACKRVRVLENKRRVPILMPSELSPFAAIASLTQSSSHRPEC